MLWDQNIKIKKYNDVYQIMDEFYDVRLSYYDKRKTYMLSKLEYDRKVLYNKMKFINYILKGELKINNEKKENIEKRL